MNKRKFLTAIVTLASAPLLSKKVLGATMGTPTKIVKIHKAAAEWKQLLPADRFYILREEGTERASTSPLNKEKGKGIYVCAGCDLPLFTSEMKYDSGTGWPSFTATMQGHVETRTDFKSFYPRTEYHCARCDGHQGHVFDDGPPPTGKRYCNNGLALKFIPS